MKSSAVARHQSLRFALLAACLLIVSSMSVFIALPSRASSAQSAGVTISTELSSSEITVGGSVVDSSTLTGVAQSGGGTVTYSIFSGVTCSGPFLVIPTVTNGLIVPVESGPKVQPSSSETFSSAGNYSWNAFYSGGVTSSCEVLKVDKAKPSISISFSSDLITVGAFARALALMTNPSSTAGGTVQYEYFPGNNCAGKSFAVGPPVAVADGVVPASFYEQFPSAGNYSWNAVYSGDGNNTSRTSPCNTKLIVSAALVKATTGLVALGGSSLPITVGGSLAFSVSLSSATSSAGGKITYRYFGLSDGTCRPPWKTIGVPVNVTNGVVPNSALQKFHSAGIYSADALYTGDSNNTGVASTCVTFTVSKANPAITMSLSNSSIAVGKFVTVSATLIGGYYATGTITYNLFSNDACTGQALQVLGPVTLTNSLTGFSPKSPGTFSLNAVYNPGNDLNNTGATSQACEAVTAYSGSVSITTQLSALAINAGQSVTDMAILSGTTGGGGVTFEWFTGSFCTGTPTTVGTASVTNNKASITSQPFYTAGPYSWNALYGGSTSPCEQLTVGNLSYTDFTVSCAHDSVAVGISTSCEATIYGSKTSPPKGTLSWSSSGSGKFLPKSSCQLLSHRPANYSTCSVEFMPTAAGSFNLTVSFPGDVHNLASSLAHIVTATAKASTTSVSCSPSSFPAASSRKTTTVKCKATVRGYGDLTNESVSWAATGTGFVSLSTSTCVLVKGSCIVTLTGTQPGSVVLTATYSGDPNNLGSSRTAKLTVTKAIS